MPGKKAIRESGLFILNPIDYIGNLMNEQQLVSRAKAGDFQAFMTLVDAHKGKIYGLAQKLAGNKEDAEDIVQDTLLKAIDKIDQFRGEASFGTWLYSIALNQARALFARSKQADLKPIEEYLPGGNNHGESSPDSAKLFDWGDPHQELEASELRRIIDEVVAELPYKYREAFLLRYIEELPVKEVAALIHESEAATKSRILRARLAIRDRLTTIFGERYAQRLP
jgi:RNA polymerase sigma-70 factor (ECF subfamily)